MTARFDCIQMLHTRGRVVERLSLTERRVIVVSRIQKNDWSLVQLLQILMYVKILLVRRSVRDVDNRITRLPRQLTIHGKTYREDSADRKRQLRLCRHHHAITSTKRPPRQDHWRFAVNPRARERLSRDVVVVTRKLFRRYRFFRAREIHEITLRIDTDDSNTSRRDVCCDVRAERTPTAVATREEHELLIGRVLPLIKLQIEWWTIADRHLESRVFEFVRQLFVRHVVIETVIPPHCVHGHATNEQKHCPDYFTPHFSV